MNPNLTQQELVEYCKDKGIVVIAHSPLGSIPIIKNRKDSPNPHIDDPVLKSIADKYNKNSIQVVLRYLVNIIPL